MNLIRSESALVWFRRDLRVDDHAALSHALRDYRKVYCLFVFDTEILEALPRRDDRRVEFIRESLVELDRGLDELSRGAGGAGSGLTVLHGAARDLVAATAFELEVDAVLCNRDYEPSAIERDADVAERLRTRGVRFIQFKDQVIFEKSEVLTQSGTPFTVFTPYKRAWLKALETQPPTPFPVAPRAAALAPGAGGGVPALQALGFEPTNLSELALPCGMSGARRLLEDFRGRIDHYKVARDFPARKGESYLSTHLRFGTISIRRLVSEALGAGSEGGDTWLSELIWRDFYEQILWHHPHVVERSFRSAFDRIEWVTDPAGFAAWCEARTGYPIVDAAMRQINQTGYMHNRLRMIVASFLTKDLGIHWRSGERYFAEHLNDFDLAANNGGWQWAASTGCDAQPWFRIFNPVTQSERFDPRGGFIRRYLPELANVPDRFIHAPWTMSPVDQSAARCRIGSDYPLPIVDHAEARKRTLERFEVVRADGQDAV